MPSLGDLLDLSKHVVRQIRFAWHPVETRKAFKTGTASHALESLTGDSLTLRKELPNGGYAGQDYWIASGNRFGLIAC